MYDKMKKELKRPDLMTREGAFMNYAAFSLNGTWKMCYKEEEYRDNVNPWNNNELRLNSEAAEVDSAVPGYWEDMTDKFIFTPFYRGIRINPEYGIQKYPITGFAPDMALPNPVGNFFYQRTFLCEDIKKDACLHFDGVQNKVSVWINDEFIGMHEGYSAPFDIKIPDGLLTDGENTVSLSVSNFRLKGYGGYPVSGLTSRAANECTGGITGDVELRVYNSPLRDVVIKISDDTKRVFVSVVSERAGEFSYTVKDGDKVIKKGEADGDFSFDTEGMGLWSPESPKLYTLTVKSGEGFIERKFGVRRLLPDGPHFRLNGVPYFLRGICEHCYFPETIHPAHDLTYYRSIVREIKKLGFNFIRFHTYIPEEEYMQAADELGILLHVESPNNTSLDEWKEIVNFCRRHTSVVIYCCGNELQMDDDFIAHLNKCADEVHEKTDSLFSPLSALRGLEYNHVEESQKDNLVREPFPHNPKRIARVGEFADMYSSYTNDRHSYNSPACDPAEIDSWSEVYNHKPRVSHEICIDGTYTDLSMEERYKGLRVGKTEMFSSIREHLTDAGLIKNAPLYFRNSSEWQRRARKYCFEAVRRSENMAGYDFLGPIDTHWHTFGYDCGMMNEFYELKPGETVRNVRMYNSETVLLTDLSRKANFASNEALSCNIICSCYAKEALTNARLDIRLMAEDEVFERKSVNIEKIENGKVSSICKLNMTMPKVTGAKALKLYVSLENDRFFAENEWELYVYPETAEEKSGDILVATGMTEDELISALKAGCDVLILGASPFPVKRLERKPALPGRSSGNLASVIYDHPAINGIPNEGFCGWQFDELMAGGNAVCFWDKAVPFKPIVEIVSTHKYAIRQAALFEFSAYGGRCVVCSFNLNNGGVTGNFMKSELIKYMKSGDFNPGEFTPEELSKLIHGQGQNVIGNVNLAFNPNDKTAVRKK